MGDMYTNHALINKRQPHPRIKQEIFDAISKEWEILQPKDYQTAIDQHASACSTSHWSS